MLEACYVLTMLAEKIRTGIAVDHPAWQAALRAPVVPETEEEREAVAEAMRSGKLVSGAEVSAEIAKRSRG